MSESSNGDNAPQHLSARGVESPQTNRVDPQFGVSLTPTSSVAVMGLTSMRYGVTDNATTPGDFLPPAGLLNTMAFSGLPIGRYLSSLEMYERRNSGTAQQLRVPLGHSPLATNPAMAALAAANARALAGPGSAVDWFVASQTLMLGTPIATTCTTPALFVNSSQARSAPNPGAMPIDGPNTQRPQPQVQPLHQTAGTHTTSPLRAAMLADHDYKRSPVTDRQRGRGRGRGRGAGCSSARQLYDTNHMGPAAGSLSTTAASSPSNRNTGSPPETPTLHSSRAGDADGDRIVQMEDLVGRGAVARLQMSPPLYEIPSDLLAAGRSSITIGAAVGGDKRRFNLKWLYDYPWLRFDPQSNAMLCALCKRGKRANQFAKKGSRNFKTSALVDHSSSNDHQRSVAQFGELPRSDDLAMTLQDGAWVASPKFPERSSRVAQLLACDIGAGGNTESPHQSSVSMALSGAAEQPNNQLTTSQPIVVSSPLLVSANTSTDPVAEQMGASHSAFVNKCSTADTTTTVASRLTPIDEHMYEDLDCRQHKVQQQNNQASRVQHQQQPLSMAIGGSAEPVHRKRSRDTIGSTTSSQPDERYAKEFEHAVQALLQAMHLNLPISAVADLYRLKIEPTPLANIGAVGYVDRIKSAAAAADNSSSSRSATDLRLAGALASTTEAARTLQHVVSSEILSLVKDEVSQSPAFSVIIDEAPLCEHNSLVAHVLLYLRYMRHDPQSPDGELQVVTRFWRCVHLYHETSGRLARRDPTSLVLGLLDRSKIDINRLVCIACERPASREDEETDRRRRPHIIHWRNIFTYPNSLSPQVYEEIIHQSDDFVGFAMTLMDLCLFMYSYPSSFAFLGIDFQEMLYKTLYEIFLGEGSLSTRLPISLTPGIVIAITRSISQIMATVLALSKVPDRCEFPVSNSASNQTGTNVPDSGDIQGTQALPRSSLQIPLPVVDILVSSIGGMGSKKSVGRCPSADALFERLRDYSFLGCLHFMSDILLQIKPIIEISSNSDMPVRAFGELAEPANHTLDQRLRAYIGTIKDAIESVTLMYGDEDDSTHDHNSFGHNSFGHNESGEEEYSGFHLNEFMHLTDCEGPECSFRTFQVAHYSVDDSQCRLVDLIRSVSSAILRDLNQRFNAVDIATIQALADMWDPTQFPRNQAESATFANSQVQTLARKLSRTRSSGAGLNLLGVPVDQTGFDRLQVPQIERTLSNTPLIDTDAAANEWQVFKSQVNETLDRQISLSSARQSAQPESRYPAGKIQLAYRSMLYSEDGLAPSRRRLRSVNGSRSLQSGAHEHVEVGSSATARSNHAPKPGNGWSRFKNLSKLATAWNVLPLALSTDLYLFRRLYGRQLSRICREQAEHKLQSINFDMGDTFSELLNRLTPPHSKGKKVTVYDLLQNSKFEVQNEIDSFERPVGMELSGVTIDYFLRSIDAVTMALDHRLRLLSIGYTESPLAVARNPGECPMWMQNAMRGYWKLTCRPQKCLLSKTPASVASASYSSRQRKQPASSGGSGFNTAQSSGAPYTYDTSAQTTAVPHQRNISTDAGSKSAAAKNTSKAYTDVSMAIAGAPEPAHLHLHSSATCGTSVSNQSSLFLSPSIQPPAPYDEDVSTLPLLEALLSDSANAPPDSAPAALVSYPQDLSIHEQPQRTAMGHVQPTGMPMPQGTAKRNYDEHFVTTAAMQSMYPMAPVAPVASGSGQFSMPPGMPPNKRMRQSEGAIPTYNTRGGGFGYGGYAYPANTFEGQQQHHRNQQLIGSVQDGYALDPAIARLASDIGLDSVSTQALAASISNQSSRMMPGPELEGNSSSMSLSLSASGIQQLQQHQAPGPAAPFPDNLMMQNAANNQMFAVAAAMNPQQQHQYAATQMAFVSQASGQPLHLANVPSLPTVPSMSAAHMGSRQSMDQIMTDSQRQPSVTSVSGTNIPRLVPSNAFGYQMHSYIPDNAKR